MTGNLFTGLAVDPALSPLLESIRRPLRGAKKVHPLDYHVTLKYLGPVLENKLTEFWLEASTFISPSFEIVLTGVDIWKHQGKRYLVARVEGNDDLQNLWQHHEDSAVAVGLKARPEYRPHVTLARYYQAQPLVEKRILDEWADKTLGSWTVTGFHLMASIRPRNHKNGRYACLETVVLG